nr:ATP-dependent Clp protease proteolytic subunit [Desulfobulbaceae bacterium]
MKSALISIVVVFFMGIPLSLTAKDSAGPLPQTTLSTTNVFVIPVSGDVEPVMAAYIKRAVADALTSVSEPLIVLEIDTFGGRVDAALNIVDTMMGISRGQSIAFVKTKAISAGALIALSCNSLVMRPSTTLGDCAPISFDGNEAKMLGEKFQSPLRAKFRTLARKNGYPPALAESMVSARMEVFRVSFPDKTLYLDAEALADLSEAETKMIVSKTTVVAKDELLTMDDAEAHELGFSTMTAESIEDMLGKMNIKNFDLVRLEQNWAESWGRRIAMISPILMIIGMAALYTEFKAPGFGLPGITGLICLGLVLFNQHIVGLADNLELILFALGLILLGFEVFVIPGFGIAGISGFMLIGAGLILSFQDFVLPDPAMPWQAELFAANLTRVLIALVGSFLLSLAFIRYGLPRLGRYVQGPYLDDTLADSHAPAQEAMQVAVGQTGLAATALRPAGKMNIGDSNIDVVAEGVFIDKGSVVRVIAVKGSRVVVAPVPDEGNG